MLTHSAVSTYYFNMIYCRVIFFVSVLNITILSLTLTFKGPIKSTTISYHDLVIKYISLREKTVTFARKVYASDNGCIKKGRLGVVANYHENAD